MACSQITHVWTRTGTRSDPDLRDYDLCDCGGMMFGSARYYRDEIAAWKARAERWKDMAKGYRRFCAILALIPYTARNRRMLMGFGSKPQ